MIEPRISRQWMECWWAHYGRVQDERPRARISELQVETTIRTIKDFGPAGVDYPTSKGVIRIEHGDTVPTIE